MNDMEIFWMLSGMGAFLFLGCAGIALIIWVIGRDDK